MFINLVLTGEIDKRYYLKVESPSQRIQLFVLQSIGGEVRLKKTLMTVDVSARNLPVLTLSYYD
jgi:hypothetical protein